MVTVPVLANAACFAALGHRAFSVYGTLTVLVSMIAWGTAVLVPASAVGLLMTPRVPIGLRHTVLVLFLAAGFSALIFALWGFVTRHHEIGRAVVFNNLIPVSGARLRCWSCARAQPCGS